ncbi:tRNA (cytidine(34)-2'-O)-methyltransferase [Malacoplasma iowae]|uniref:Putative tRNA (cytidine(34)-2'-O)-methyltransferase n=2 Tax=Malacoplasma iowae TaxID=2116 RepID=A0A084U452_MALIO|nr:tRNA (cytidine(34)-2'-O)-methyltransferase [Malacoplasma iowae]VEU62161.1 SpoU class rRNA methylase [Mycoplasmopsis fermentans]EGZ31484.1 rRNA methylase [Malacoplasma iowae 695]KFB07738.1 rRNA methylase, SpoU class [Malacoplasma iowae DK-CPA]QHG89937.1 tRNA (cytidine(34)-2'-O)-methyltransferase [Malacoplasma iowae 695]WPL36335.1 tRNA (cytidine(34)-2'-O)-methyltransferase [Malacoplasma iowae]
MLHIVLFQPEIPQNTGNIARTCVGFNAKLHLIKPYGFILDDKRMIRAGLDYWEHLNIEEHDSWEEFENKYNISINSNIYLISKFGKNKLEEVVFKSDQEETFFVFGRETKGLSEKIMDKYKEKLYSINMSEKIRSFNLSNCVAMVAYDFNKQMLKTNKK